MSLEEMLLRNELERLEASSGEMEGAGVSGAAIRAHTEWIVVKGVSDWGDGLKHDGYQALAAASAADLALEVFKDPHALDGI